MSFVTKLVLRDTGYVRGGRTLYRLARHLVYRGRREVFIVQAGFETDLASVPRLFWAWFPPNDPLYQAPAVVHDHLYRTHEVSRRDADGIFLRQMRELGVSWVRRRLIYLAVRAGGKAAYRAHD